MKVLAANGPVSPEHWQRYWRGSTDEVLAGLGLEDDHE